MLQWRTINSPETVLRTTQIKQFLFRVNRMNEVLINADENRGSTLRPLSLPREEGEGLFKGPLARYLVLLTKNRKTSWVAVTVRARPINHRLVAFPHAYRNVFVSPFHHRHRNGYRLTTVVPNSKPIPPSLLASFPRSSRIEFRFRSRDVSILFHPTAK